MKKYWLILLLFSCSPTKTTTDKNGVLVFPVMTNQELTAAVHEIQKAMVLPDTNNFVIRDSGLYFKSKVYFDSVVVKSGWLYVGNPPLIRDTTKDNGGGIDTIIIEPHDIMRRFNDNDLKDAIWVRSFFERLTDSLFRANDSLQMIINKK